MLPVERTIIPHAVLGQEIVACGPGATVRETARLMARRRVGAAMVVESDKLLGIFTERDVMTRVIAETRDPDATIVSDVMTLEPATVNASDSVVDALDLMNARGFRHLPVMEQGRLVGIVSIRDLYRSVKEQMDEDILLLAETLIQG